MELFVWVIVCLKVVYFLITMGEMFGESATYRMKINDMSTGEKFGSFIGIILSFGIIMWGCSLLLLANS